MQLEVKIFLQVLKRKYQVGFNDRLKVFQAMPRKSWFVYVIAGSKYTSKHGIPGGYDANV